MPLKLPIKKNKNPKAANPSKWLRCQICHILGSVFLFKGANKLKFGVGSEDGASSVEKAALSSRI